MTLFLSIPEVEEGLSAAHKAVGAVDQTSLDQKKQELITLLNDMLNFATENLNSMLTIMGFSSIDQLNDALHNYNQLNISLQQLFPAMSEPQITEVLARSGIGNMTQNADYGLVISALEDSIKSMFPQFVGAEFNSPEVQQKIRQILSSDGIKAKLAVDIAGRLFGGVHGGQALVDLNEGKIVDMNKALGNLVSTINKNTKARGSTGTNLRTIFPFINDFLIPYINDLLSSNIQLFAAEENYKQMEKALEPFAGKIKREVLVERIRRGGITISAKIKSSTNVNEDSVQIMPYLDQLQVGVDKSIFDVRNRGKKSIETYVNDLCNAEGNEGLRDRIIQNIKKFYWNIIISYIPRNVNNPLMEDKFNEIINQMVDQKGGSIGWFFSQGTTKAGGAGMFGEIAGMIYLALLCPKLQDNAKLLWAGGTIQGSAKPPADIIIGNALQQYGIQVKNYTSGSILSHEYNLKIKNIIDQAANTTDDDLMTLQTVSELGITPEEIEAVQNIIISNTFNVPYQKDKISKRFVQAQNDVFSDTRNQIDIAYMQATKYMAVISVIMHRLQFREEVIRKISSTKEELQLQNTLWLINGAMFVSSVQILEQLIKYVQEEEDKFFGISSSLRIRKEDAVGGLKEGNFTIVEYYNYSAKKLGTTALSKVSASIGTNYRMSVFGV